MGRILMSTKLVRLTGESSNDLFQTLEQWNQVLAKAPSLDL